MDTTTKVADCGHTYTGPALGESGGSGYARLRDAQYVPTIDHELPADSTICYSCADACQIRELDDGRNDIYAYVSGDGESVTTWTGGELMHITWMSGSDQRVTPTGGRYERFYVDAVDVWGQHWRGVGSGRGMSIRMRRVNPRPGVPADYPVRPLTQADIARMDNPRDIAQCGTCGRYWDDGVATGMTPAPGGRCPFEYFH